jgi:hypothetical protein
MSQDEQAPLADTFYLNPLEYMQNHVRNLNNEIFLSEYHINTLYALLLVGRNSPWDLVKYLSPHLEATVLTLRKKLISSSTKKSPTSKPSLKTYLTCTRTKPRKVPSVKSKS